MSSLQSLLLGTSPAAGHSHTVVRLYYCILITACSEKENLSIPDFHTCWINRWGNANLTWKLPGFSLNSGTRSRRSWLLLVCLYCDLGATWLFQLSRASLSPSGDKWCPWNTLLAAGVVGQSRGRGVQGGAACTRKSCCLHCPITPMLSCTALAGLARDDRQSNRVEALKNPLTKLMPCVELVIYLMLGFEQWSG